MTNLQTLPATISEKAGQALDLLWDKTGFVAVRDRLYHPGGDDVVTLDVSGYRQTNNRVYIAGDGPPWIGKREYLWQDFVRRWRPKGFGLVCWGKS